MGSALYKGDFRGWDKKYGSVYGKTFSEAKEKQELCIRNNSLHKVKKYSYTLSGIMYEWLEFTKNTIKNQLIKNTRVLSEITLRAVFSVKLLSVILLLTQ